MVLNLTAWVREWDPYPFITLNLLFSVQAAYAAPILMMNQNRQAERDRLQAQADLDTDVKAEREIADVADRLDRSEQAIARIEGSATGVKPPADKHGPLRRKALI